MDKPDCWGHNSVLRLLSLYVKRRDDYYRHGVKKQVIWSEISSELEKNGYFFSTELCAAKIRSLKYR